MRPLCNHLAADATGRRLQHGSNPRAGVSTMMLLLACAGGAFTGAVPAHAQTCLSCGGGGGGGVGVGGGGGGGGGLAQTESAVTVSSGFTVVGGGGGGGGGGQNGTEGNFGGGGGGGAGIAVLYSGITATITNYGAISGGGGGGGGSGAGGGGGGNGYVSGEHGGGVGPGGGVGVGNPTYGGGGGGGGGNPTYGGVNGGNGGASGGGGNGGNGNDGYFLGSVGGGGGGGNSLFYDRGFDGVVTIGGRGGGNYDGIGGTDGGGGFGGDGLVSSVFTGQTSAVNLTIINFGSIMAGSGGAAGVRGAGSIVYTPTNYVGSFGGAGGTGIYGENLTTINFGSITGGRGGSGDGGNGSGGGGGSGSFYGFGGNGGAGIRAVDSSITNNAGATIAGGDGGNGHGHGLSLGGYPSVGPGGVGITGSGLAVTNGGTISGGLSGDGTTRADAITFLAPDGSNINKSNSLTLNAGYAFIGNVAAAAGGSDTLALGGTASASFDVSQIGGQYRNFANFAKTGSSTWTLTGTTSAAVPWTVNAGVLEVAGSIVSSSLTSVMSGGTLIGAGSVGNTQVNAGGTFAPGNGTPGSSMTIAGNLAFQSGAAYLVQLNPSAASFANVTGTATLGGATANAVYANGSYVSKRYTLVSAAGGLSGTFNSLVNTNLPANFTTALGYDANNAYLNLTLNYMPSAPDYGRGLSTNQQNVANALIGSFNANGGIPLVYGALSPGGLALASGESATGAQQATFDAMNMFLGLLIDPSTAGRDGGLGSIAAAVPFADESAALDYAAGKSAPTGAFASMSRKASSRPMVYEPRWSVWAAGYGGSQATSGNAVTGSNSTSSSIYGTAVGADYRFSPDTLAGFAIAAGGTGFSVNGLGSGRSDLFQAGAFVRHTIGPAYVSAALAYGWQDITTNRNVAIVGLDHLRAEYNANSWSGRIEGGYRYATPWLGITPYAAGQFTIFDLPGYGERAAEGGGAFALNYAAKSVTDSRSELGLRTDKAFVLDGGIVTLRSRFAWAHDFNPDRTITATFRALPLASFTVNGAARASNAVLTTAAAEINWRNGWSASVTFEGEFSNVTSSYAGKGVLRYAW